MKILYFFITLLFVSKTTFANKCADTFFLLRQSKADRALESSTPTTRVEEVKIVSRIEEDFEKLFLATEGKTYKEFVMMLKESSEPLVQRALEMIDNQSIDLAMRRNETRRESIVSNGFLNQFTTGTVEPEVRR